MNLAQARQALVTSMAPLAPVTLLFGPGIAGMWKLGAQAFAARGGTHRAVTLLDALAARDIVREAVVAPFGEFKNFQIGLDGSSEQAQNVLLKVLEEPPSTARFILVATTAPLPTVVSRARVLRVSGPVAGWLEDDSEESQRARAMVQAALKAAQSGARSVAADRGWKPEHTVWLSLWATEAASGRWKLFSPGFAPGVTSGQARRLVIALSCYPGARTGAAAALDAVFRKE